jgi:hypothetical protein
MSFFIFLNGHSYFKDYYKVYNPVWTIDLKDQNMQCKKKNKLLFFCENPRSNIELIVGQLEFYFTFEPENNMIGQLCSTILINYHIDKNIQNHVYENFIIFTEGYKITEMIIYFPVMNFPFLRQLKYYFYSKTTGRCDICFEEKHNIVFVDEFHSFCVDCVLQSSKTCPICRKQID